MKFKTLLLVLALSFGTAAFSQAKKTCKGLTKSGQACKMAAQTGSDYCRLHNPEALRCGAPTKSGKPCQIVVKTKGAKCWRHKQ